LSIYFHAHPARSDRYSHEFVSDEEEGDDETFQQPFENFSSTAPRFSHLLELSFEEGEPTSPQKKVMMEIRYFVGHFVFRTGTTYLVF